MGGRSVDQPAVLGAWVTLLSDHTQPQTGGALAGQLRWLRANRLLGVVDLLVERGVVLPAVRNLAGPLIERHGLVPARQMAAESEVMGSLASGGVRALALKGLLLSHTVYPEPNQRLRVDLDVLVSPEELEPARKTLKEIGYRPMFSVPGGTPLEQEAWVRQTHGFGHMIDLHWRLRNHPCLRERFDFEPQWQESIALPSLAAGARGQGRVHALINASMHWFDSLYADDYPLVWLFDKDLLWRAMSDAERRQTEHMAGERGLAGLLAESLRQARGHFSTPVDDDTIERLAHAGQGRRPTRLLSVRHSRLRAHLFALRCEPGLRGKAWRLKESLFPPASHLRERFPDGSRFGVAGLWGRRIGKRLKG